MYYLSKGEIYTWNALGDFCRFGLTGRTWNESFFVSHVRKYAIIFIKSSYVWGKFLCTPGKKLNGTWTAVPVVRSAGRGSILSWAGREGAGRAAGLRPDHPWGDLYYQYPEMSSAGQPGSAGGGKAGFPDHPGEAEGSGRVKKISIDWNLIADYYGKDYN